MDTHSNQTKRDVFHPMCYYWTCQKQFECEWIMESVGCTWHINVMGQLKSASNKTQTHMTQINKQTAHAAPNETFWNTFSFQGNVYQRIGAVDVYRRVCSFLLSLRYCWSYFNWHLSVRLDCIAEREVQTSWMSAKSNSMPFGSFFFSVVVVVVVAVIVGVGGIDDIKRRNNKIESWVIADSNKTNV